MQCMYCHSRLTAAFNFVPLGRRLLALQGSSAKEENHSACDQVTN